MMSRSVLSVRCAAAGTATASAKAKNLKALNVTKNTIVSNGGVSTRNVDGVVYELSYDATQDAITVVDRARQISYPAVVGVKDNRISIDLDSPTLLTSAASFEQLQAVLRGDAPGAEAINGRVAMLAFLGCSAVELATQQTVAEQLLSPVGAIAAVALASSVLIASIAPALAGKQRADKLFPSLNDPYADRQMPYYFHPLAETLNGRAAMIGMLGLVGYELVKGTPLL